jgi:hypothetical protein
MVLLDVQRNKIDHRIIPTTIISFNIDASICGTIAVKR